MTSKERVLAVYVYASAYQELESGVWGIFTTIGQTFGQTKWFETEEAAWKNAAESLPPEPAQETKLTDVYEVYGSSARSQGRDFMVCKTLKEALGVIEGDLDELDADPDKEDEVRIVFRRYTEAQMEDVIYE